MTTVTVSGGVATFSNLLLTTAGTYTLDANSGSLNQVNSASFVINPAAADHLAFVQQPTDTTAGPSNPITPAVTVEILDKYNNPLTGDNADRVTVAVNGGPSSSLNGTPTVTVSGGVATFSTLSLTTAGTYTLDANSGSLNQVNSASFVINPAAASQLVLTQQPSSTATAGVLFSTQPVVKEEDQFGNVVSDSTNTVTAATGTLGSASLQLPSTLTVTLVNGVAAFSGLFYDKAETMNIGFTTTAGSFTATSNNVVVSPAAANSLVVAGFPLSNTAGDTQIYTVTALDAFNNVATGYTGTVTFSSTDPQAVYPALYTYKPTDAGVHSFIATLKTAGTWSITASSTDVQTLTLGSGITGGSFTLTFNGQPAGPINWDPSGSTLATNIQNALAGLLNVGTGNVSVSGTGPFTITFSSAVSKPTAITVASNSLTPSGSTITLAPSLTGSESGIQVSPSLTNDHLAFVQQPTNTTASNTNPISPAVTVGIYDQFGNLLMGDSSDQVSVAVNSGPSSSLNGMLTATVSSGVASFSTLSLSTAGTYTLDATSGSLGQVNSASFVVSPAGADHLAFVQQPTNTTAGPSNLITPPVTVEIFDQFNNVLTGDNSDQVTVAVNTGPTTSLNGTLTATVNHGVASFSNLSLNTAGIYTLDATSSTLPLLHQVNSTSFVISPAGADHLAFVQQPTNTTAGPSNPITPAVTVGIFDKFNNQLTGDNADQVTVAINSGPSSSLNGALTATVSGGVVTFSNLSLNTAGTYTLDANSGTLPLLSQINSTSFVISPAGADHLAFVQQPTNTTAGPTNPISPAVTVEILDQFNNVLAGDNSDQVTVAVNSGPSSNLNGTLTATVNHGVASFSTLSLNTAGTYTLDATSGSLNQVNSASFVINPAAASKLVVTGFPTSTTAGATQSFTVTAEDQFNNVVPTYTGTVTLTSSAGQATFAPASYLFTSGDKGVHTFNATLDKAVTQTIMATDTGLDPTNGISGQDTNITVNPASPSKLVVSGFPATTAGVAQSFTVTAKDAFGNNATSYTGTVSFSSSDNNPQTLLPMNYTFTSGTGSGFDNGAHTFMLGATLTTAGTQSITATDLGSGFIASQSGIQVTPAAASTLSVSGYPNPTTSGADEAFTVTAYDPYGNVATGYRGLVTLMSSDSLATFNGNSNPGPISYTFTTGDAGVSQGLGATLVTGGPQSITAVDFNNSTITGTQSGIVVITGASQLVLSGFPATTVAGVAQTITVTAENSTGGVALGYTGTVTFTSSDIQAGLPAAYTFTSGAGFDNGVHTFVLGAILKTAGLQSISVSDGSNSASETGITVTNASFDHLALTGFPNPTTAGLPQTFTVTAEDQFGNAVPDYVGSISFSSSDAKANLPEPYVFTGSGTGTGFDNGIHTFTATLYTAGTRSITVNDGVPAQAGSQSVQVNPAGAASLVVMGFPNTTVAGAQYYNFTVTAEDSFGNVATGYIGTVMIGSSDAQANFAPSTYQFTSTDLGQHTFQGILKTAGAESITATDTAPMSQIASVPESVQVSPAATPDHLAFIQQPTNTTAGPSNPVNPAVTVEILDKYNNVLTGDNSDHVTVAINSGPSTSLSGTLTETVSSGVATFSDLSLNTAGTYTLDAKSGTLPLLTQVNSTSFVISPAAADHLAFVQQPTNTSAGPSNPITPAVTVEILDKYNNVLTGDNSDQVTVAVNSGPSTSLNGTLTETVHGGVATFSDLSLNTVGTYTLDANSGSLAQVNSSSFVISPAAADHLAFVQQPTNTTAGPSNPITPAVTVEILDKYNNVLTGDNSDQVTVAINSGPGTSLNGTLTETVHGGVATFSDLSLNTAGTYTLDANGDSLTQVNSSSFVISPAAADHLAFVQQPTNTTAGPSNPITPAVTVEILDKYNNVLTGDNSDQITVAVSTGPSTSLNGTLTETVSSGVATFSDLSLNTAGTYVLDAKSGTLPLLTQVNSAGFVVSPAAADHLAFVQQPTNTTAGPSNPISPAVTVEILDKYNNVLTGDNSDHVTVAVNSGPSTSLNGMLTETVSSGVATFSDLSLNTAGTYTLDANSGSLAQVNSASVVISPAAADHLAFVQQPTNATAGPSNPITPAVTVEILDKYNNVLTGDSSDQVTLAVNSGPSTSLNGTLTATVSSGVATFSDLSLNTAGTYTLDANSGSLSQVPSSSFVISPAAADHLTFGQQPTNTTAGPSNPINPAVTVEILDKYNNVLTGDNSDQVTVAINSGPSTSLNGMLTATVHAGVATFSDLSLNTAGTYILDANSGSLSQVLSSSFVISPAAADHLAFVQQPTNTTAGPSNPITPAVTVEILDKYNNVLTGDNSDQVTVAINSGPSTSLNGTLTATVSSGVATFSDLSLNTAGTYVLDAKSGTLPLLTQVNSAGFVVSPAAADHLAFVQQPTNTTAGPSNPISPAVTVEILDKYNNVLTGDNSDHVTVAVNSGPSTSLNGMLTETVSSGVATFSDLSLNTAGTYALDAKSGTLPLLTQVNSTSFVISPAAADHLKYGQQPTNTTAGPSNPISPAVTVEILDAFNNVLTGDNTDRVTVGINTGPSTNLNGTLTATVSGGVATFSDLSLNTAGAYTLNANSSTLTLLSQVNSASFVINPAAADHLAFVQQPTNATAGPSNPITPAVTVEILDKYNNVLTGDNSDHVTVAVNSGPSTSLNGTLTETVSGGVATFSDLSLNTAGTYTLDANSGTLSQVPSSSFVISPAGADHLTFGQQPTNTTAGPSNPITPAVTVEILDKYNNVLTGDNSDQVTVAINSGPSTSLNGMLTATVHAGVATFSNLSINTAGTYTLDAKSGPLSQVPSSSFVINPAGASSLVVSGFPTGTTAGATHSFTVTAYDTYGNVATGYTGTVSFESSDPQATFSPTTSYTFTTGGAWADNGMHVFSGTLKTAGPQTISANDGTLSGSDSVTVTPAAASQLVVTTAPSNTATAGVNFTTQPVVKEEDPFGNLISDSSHTVTAARGNLGTASLQGSNLTVTLSNGVATFSGLSYDVAENMNILFSTNASGVSSIASNAIAVSPNVATHFSIAAPASQQLGTSFNFTVTAQDAFSNTASSYAGTVKFTSSDTKATLPGNSSLSHGVGTFSATLNTASVQTITATDSTSSTIKGQASINSLTATQFVVSVPSTATAGTAITTIKVTAEKANGTTATNYNGTVHFTSSDGKAILPVNSTLVNGVGTFTVTFETAGSMSLVATDTVNPSVAGSNSLTVNPATAASVKVTGGNSQSATAGLSFGLPLTVLVMDKFGNVVPGVTVTFAAPTSGASAALAVGTTATTDSTGHASKTLTANTLVGAYTVTAAVTVVTTKASFSLSNVPAATASFVVSAPTTATAGTPFSITVTAVDPFGNVTPNYTGTIHFTSTDTGSGVVLPGNALQDYVFTGFGSGKDNGVHTFTATSGGLVTLVTAANQTITATDVTNPPLTTGTTKSPITVKPSTASLVTATAGNNQIASVKQSFASPLTIQVTDRYGNGVPGVTVTFSVPATGASATTVSGGFTAVTNVTGYASTKTLTANASAGSYNVTATASGATRGNFALTNTPQAATHFSLSGVPLSATAGTPFSITVTALDAYGNVATGYVGTVQFSTTDPGLNGFFPSLPTNYQFMGGDNGVSTFPGSVTLIKAGTQKLTVQDDVTSTITGSASLTVIPGAAASFLVSGPSTATAGVAGSFTVTALDAVGNVATSENRAVQLSSSDTAAGVVLGTADATLVASGHGSFLATFQSTGPQTVTVTDPNTLISGVSNADVVHQPPASIAIVSGNGQQITVNSTAGQLLTVVVLDRSGNPVQGVTVTFSAPATGASVTFVNGNTATTDSTGQASIAVSANKVLGSYGVAATVAGVSLASPFTLANVAGATTHFQISYPTVTRGQPFTITVLALDQAGNLSAGYSGTVQYSFSGPSSSALPPTPGVISFVNGKATISVAGLNVSGSWYLTLTDTSDSSLTNTLLLSVPVNLLS